LRHATQSTRCLTLITLTLRLAYATSQRTHYATCHTHIAGKQRIGRMPHGAYRTPGGATLPAHHRCSPSRGTVLSETVRLPLYLISSIDGGQICGSLCLGEVQPLILLQHAFPYATCLCTAPFNTPHTYPVATVLPSTARLRAFLPVYSIPHRCATCWAFIHPMFIPLASCAIGSHFCLYQT